MSSSVVVLVDDARFEARLTETDGEGVPIPELCDVRFSQPDIELVFE